MCDIFKQKDIIAKLKGKSFLFLGDSIMRNLYKDLVWLTTSPYENFIPTRWMVRKGTNFNEIQKSRIGRERVYQNIKKLQILGFPFS